ncbi:hypothetical protein KP509_06G071200 [Ceratopteris richardii]|uniref:non-specific serine/threonine protein kinase n=1 Tax=Ceratopteris richardii TaxID=49495 RepID=A0A8T2UNY8_CERRI|nr:hypothetical protein KP509_06G071200 [Ceratopteris richardii]
MFFKHFCVCFLNQWSRYRAFDDLDGIEVAWNQVDIRSTLHNSGDMERLYSELHLLKMLKHGNIMKFCYSWVDHQRKTVNFITEIFTSGTLRQYRQKHKRVNLKAIKHWCRQILKGLVYLHGHDPPVIHRDLKCDNIFINGNSGEVKIGDLGLAVILSQASAAHSVIGTPEFMAPELYEEHYNELVDIYSFGMCLLELVTFEYPYSECTNAAQIYKKVTSGRKPEALNRVKDLEMRKFIEKCLASASERLHADELLMDKFLQMDDNQGVTPFCQSIQLDPHDDLGDLYSTFKGRNCKDTGKDCEVSQDKLPGNASVSKPGILLSKDHGQDIQVRAPRWKKSKDFRIKVKKLEDRKVHVRFRITSSAGDVRFIQFDFDLDTDTAITVAQEMVSELDLVDQDPVNVAEMIDMELMALLPEWKRVSCLEEAEISRYIHRQPQCLPEGSEVVMSKTETINAPSFTIETSEDIRSSNEICMHGRFEEVEFHLSECQDARQEPDSTGGFSDFSSEQFEGGYSDLSLDASFDGLSARIAINDMLSEQEMDESMTDVKRGMAFLHQESSFSLHEGDKVDHDSDTEELRMLMLLQKREVKSLQHRHDQELLTLRTQLNQEAQDSATQFMLQDQSTLRTFHGADEFNKRNDTEFQQCFTTEITELPLEAFKDRLESVACDSVAIDPYVTYTEPNMSMRSELTEKPSLESCIEQEISSSVTDLKFPAAMTDEDIEKSSFSGLPVIQSRSSGEFTGNKTGRLVDSSKMSAEPVSLRNGGVHSSVQQSSILKRQSYLEYYKGVSNQREKALPVKQHSTSDGASKHSDQRDDQVEQARKLHLQKTIAELEAKTLECLLQSSSYVAKSTGKNPSVTSFQGSQSTSLGR